MYLSKLSDEQKELFLDLALFSMESDGVIKDQELEMVHRFCEEMRIDYRNKKNHASFEEVVCRLKDVSNKSELKKITVELIALKYSDEVYADEEAEILDCMKKIFKFSSHEMEDLIYYTRHLLNSCEAVNNIVK